MFGISCRFHVTDVALLFVVNIGRTMPTNVVVLCRYCVLLASCTHTRRKHAAFFWQAAAVPSSLPHVQYKCHKVGCSATQLMPVECPVCHGNFCLGCASSVLVPVTLLRPLCSCVVFCRHRHPDTHDCIPVPVPEAFARKEITRASPTVGVASAVARPTPAATKPVRYISRIPVD
jgi:hypothetical protein